MHVCVFGTEIKTFCNNKKKKILSKIIFYLLEIKFDWI